MEINGIKYHKRPEENISGLSSDFEIDSEISSDRPLVLPTEKGNAYKGWKYTSSIWGDEFYVPYYESKTMSERTLPFDGSKYPYLTVSDFLQDTIIINSDETSSSDSFYTNGTNNQLKNSCLLPLKPLFFKYFKPSDLINKDLLTLEDKAGAIKVELKIPVKKGEYVRYKRLYYKDNNPNIEKNEGSVYDCAKNDTFNFNFAFLPLIKFEEDSQAYYRCGLVSEFNDPKNYKVTFYNNGNIINNDKITSFVRNESIRDNRKCANFAIEKSNIDFIEIGFGKYSGIIVPKMKKQTTNDTFSFAIDFGTSNTHIEYKKNDETAKPFSLTRENKDVLINYYSNPIEDERLVFNEDFIPDIIGEVYKFPLRTALYVPTNINWSKPVYTMTNANIPFVFEKKIRYEYNNVLTNLKWSNEEANKQKVECYIDSLMFIIRNKVLLNNGDLKKTKIVWFYPISMTKARYNKFKRIWEESYKKYFGDNNDDNNIIPMTESVAPYEFYRKSVAAASNMVTIDIGGGTSDVVIANDNKIECITSFRFAANSIFGDGYTQESNVKNGIVRLFKDKIYESLEASKIIHLCQIFEKMYDTNNSTDIASFLFSLAENEDIKKNNIQESVNFNRILRDDEKQKIVFLIFYAAIIYHIASLMNAKGLNMPRHITFSGNGSKVVSILSDDKKTLSKFTQCIFESVYDKKYEQNGIEVILNSENPKQVTCKGGLTNTVIQEYDTVNDSRVILKSTDNKTFANGEEYASVKEKKTEYISLTEENVKNFFNFVFNDLNKIFNFKNNFGIESNSIEIAKDVCYKDLGTFIAKGISQKFEDGVADDDPVDETFFFYAIVGVLHVLSNEICQANQN